MSNCLKVPYFCFVWDGVCLCSPSWCGTHNVNQDGLEPTNFTCLYHLSAGIKGGHHHTQLQSAFSHFVLHLFIVCAPMVHMQRSEGSLQESLLFFHCMRPWHQKQAIKLAGDRICLLCPHWPIEYLFLKDHCFAGLLLVGWLVFVFQTSLCS